MLLLTAPGSPLLAFVHVLLFLTLCKLLSGFLVFEGKNKCAPTSLRISGGLALKLSKLSDRVFLFLNHFVYFTLSFVLVHLDLLFKASFLHLKLMLQLLDLIFFDFFHLFD